MVTPDNGTPTHVSDKYGIRAVREIDESRNRRAGSDELNTFHGWDVYAYTGARLAAAIRLMFEDPKVVALGIASTPAGSLDSDGRSRRAALNLI